MILMLQVRLVISLVTSHPYLQFCRHIFPIALHFDRKYFLSFIYFVNWASEASPTLGCSIEISHDIYYVYVTGHGKRDHFNKVMKCSYEQVKF